MLISSFTLLINRNVEMARATQIVFVILVLLLFNINTTYSKNKCAVCKHCNVLNARPDTAYRQDYMQCFGIAGTDDGKICSTCRRAVAEFRKSGKTFFHVSKIL